MAPQLNSQPYCGIEMCIGLCDYLSMLAGVGKVQPSVVIMGFPVNLLEVCRVAFSVMDRVNI